MKYLPLAALIVIPCVASCGGGGGSSGASSPPPVVVSMDPADGVTGVALDIEVVIGFSAMMAKGTITPQNFQLIERGGAPVPGTVHFSRVVGVPFPGLAARFVPTLPLSPCTTYDVVAAAAIRDVLGQPLEAFASSFTTTGINCAPPPTPGPCVSPIDFGLAASYGVLAGSTVTNAGPTGVFGDLGVSPGTAVADAGTLSVSGATNVGAAAAPAQAALLTAYGAVAAVPGTATRDGADLGGEILTAGVYTSTSTLSVQTADLTLVGSASDVFIFRAVSSLTIASGRKILLVGVRPCNVFWWVGISAVIKSGAQFEGNVLALTDITLETGATANGRLLTQTGQVVLDTNTVIVP